MRAIWSRFASSMRRPAALSLAGLVLVLGSIEERGKGCAKSDPSGPENSTTQTVQPYQPNESVRPANPGN
jgi:hypothetical protein